MDFVKQIKSFGIIFGMVSIVLGIVLVFKPVQVETLLNTIVGVGMLVMGVTKLIQAFFMKDKEEHSNILVIVPILIVILGIFVLINSEVTMFTVGMVIAILALSLAFDRFIVANNRKKMGQPIGTTVMFGIVQLLFAVVMFWNAFAMMTAITIITGIYLIINGIMIMASSMFLKDLK